MALMMNEVAELLRGGTSLQSKLGRSGKLIWVHSASIGISPLNVSDDDSGSIRNGRLSPRQTA